jgi:hypothetical protein
MHGVIPVYPLFLSLKGKPIGELHQENIVRHNTEQMFHILAIRKSAVLIRCIK